MITRPVAGRRVYRVRQPASVKAKLAVLLTGRIVGVIYQDANGRFSFVYDEKWRANDRNYPLSISLPLIPADHGHDAINAYMWGLLPDNAPLIDAYARRFGVSSGNPAAILEHVGLDCAGSVQLVPVGAEAEYLGPPSQPTVDWLAEKDIALALREARLFGLPGSTRRTLGQFSLAGAQPKIALFESEEGKWGRPTGRTPTNRILKPPTGLHSGFAENEHCCLDLARALRLGVARSRVMQFGDETAIVVDRFDRVRIGDHSYARIHQEDFCQAFGVVPTRKYENEGGPGLAMIIDLLREYSRSAEEDVSRMIDITALNWIIAATDAHGKNFALLHGAERAVRLAPFYDIASILPYEPAELYEVKFAMKVGGEYRIRMINRHRWTAFAKNIAADADVVVGRVLAVIKAVPDEMEGVRVRALRDGLDPSAVEDLSSRIIARAKHCHTIMDRK